MTSLATPILEGTLDDIADPTLALLARRVSRELRLASLWAVAHVGDRAAYPMPADATAVERLMLRRAQSRKPEELTRAAARVKTLLGATAAARSSKFGELGAIELHARTSVTAQARAIPLPAAAVIDRTRLVALAAKSATAAAAAPIGSTTAAKLDRLELRIRRVKCLDETGSDWLGNDEISMGGSTIDETGDVRLVPAFVVNNDFDTGETKTYDPPRAFSTFDLTPGGNVWPKTYYATVVLCEQDGGGFTQFLHELQVQAKERLEGLIGEAIGVGTSGSWVSEVLRAAAAWIAEAVVNWLAELWGDDVLAPRVLCVGIHGYQHVFASGTHVSSEKTFTTTGHGGKYQVWYDWRVVAHAA